MPVSSLHASERARLRPELAGILSGTLFLLSFPPFGLAILGWCALVPLLLVRHRVDRLVLLFVGYLVAAVPVAGIAYSVAVFHVGAFMVITLAIPAAFAVAIMAADALEQQLRSPALRLLVFPSCAVAIEYVLRAVFAAPVTIALSQASHPVAIQSAASFGTSGVTFLLILANVCLERLVLWTAERGSVRIMTRELLPVIGGSALLAGNLAYGVVAVRGFGDLSRTLLVATVQPDVDSETYRERWFNPEAQKSIDARVGSLVDEALATHPDLLVLSEGSDGRFSLRVPALRARVRRIAQGTRRGLLMASPDMTPDGEELNAVFSLSPDGEVLGRYTKQILTPVGEEHLSRAGGREPLATAAGPIGAMVCFESCFPDVARQLVRRGAELLVVTTSDAPFRNGSLPLLHSAFSVFRAIENRRYVVQAANTGPSLVIDPTGAPSARSPFLRPTVLTGFVSPLTRTSLYSEIGELLPRLALAWLLLTACVLVVRRGPPIERRSERLSVQRAACAVAVLAVAASCGIVASITLSAASSGDPTDPAGSLRRFVSGATLDTPAHIKRFLQTRPNTCGAAALAFALRFYDVDTSQDAIADMVTLEDDGTSLLELADAAGRLGMEAIGLHMNVEALALRSQPTIVRVAGDHFVVVIEVANGRVLLFDPAHGLIRMPMTVFQRAWDGLALVLRFRPSMDVDGPARVAYNDAATSVLP